MALLKKIELDNGVVVNYHRIVSINKITNTTNMIEVASYTSKEKREEEKEYYASQDPSKQMNVFIDTTFINKDYEETETIQDVYNFLKTTDKFKDAVDD
jgi:ABC-type cobalamin transport system ATPase subunit